MNHGNLVKCCISRTVVACWPKSRSLQFCGMDYEVSRVNGLCLTGSLGLLSQSQGPDGSRGNVGRRMGCARPGGRPNLSRSYIGCNRLGKPI